MDRNEVAQLVDALEQPDASYQRDVMDQLVAAGPAVIDALVANLAVTPPRTRTGIVRVLAEIGHESALLPLMRFVYDNRDSFTDNDARGLAMKAVVALGGVADSSRLFQFLLDVYRDDDPFVRAYALEGLGKFGDRRALPIVQEALTDDQEFVRERAKAAVKALETKIAAAPNDDIDDNELLQSIRGRQGGERKYWLNELRARDNCFELAERLVAEGGRGVFAGLEVMLETDDPRARQVARHHAVSADDAAEKAICLRILVRHIRGDANEDELSIIRGALYDPDPFVQLAALEAAGVSGDDTLIERAVDATRDKNMERRFAAARGLSLGLTPDQRRVLPDLLQAFELANARRLAVFTEDTVKVEAYIVRAIRRVVEEGGFGTSQAQEIALTALEGATPHMPLIVTALELLDVTTPEDGFDEDRRWEHDLARNLGDLLAHHDDDVRGRALNLLMRGAPKGLNSLVDPLTRIVYDKGADIAGKVIPLLERIGSERATRLLGDLADEKDSEVRIAAEAALKRIRNGEEYIEAEFENDEL